MKQEEKQTNKASVNCRTISSSQVIQVPKTKGGKVTEEILETNGPNFSNWMKIVNPQIQEAQWPPRNTKKITPSFIIIKLLKVIKKKILKAAREKNIPAEESGWQDRRLLTKTMQARRLWSLISKVLKEKTCQPRNLCTVKISFKNKAKSKCFKHKNLNSWPADLHYKNIQWNPLAKRKWKSSGYIQRTKSTRNGNKIITKISKKMNSLSRSNNNVMLGW